MAVRDTFVPVANGDQLDDGYFNGIMTGFGRPIAKLAYNAVVADADWVNSGDVGADVFTDSNGQENTVDTVNSTGYYNTSGAYQLVIDAGDGGNHTENAQSTMTNSNGSETDSRGYRIYASDDCVLVSVTKHASSNPTRLRLFTDAGVLIATATFSGDTATFATPQKLYEGMYYRIEADNSGAGYTSKYSASASFPWNGTNINFVTGSQGGVDDNNEYNIVSAVTQDVAYTSGGTVETNEILSLGSAPKSILVYGQITLPANTSATVDVSDDGGTTFGITGQTLNSYIDTTSLSGTSLALKFTLATTDTSVTPLIYGYSVVVTAR